MPLIRIDPSITIDRKEVDYKYIDRDYSIGVNERIAVDTSNGPIVLTLPAVPSTGDTIAVSDAGGDKSVNSILIRGNGNPVVDQTITDVSFDTNHKEIRFVWNSNFWAVAD
jgi:hypothetical protein